MKKAIFAVMMFVAAQARAGIYYNLANNVSSDTLRVGYAGADRNDSVFVASGTLTAQSTSATSGYTVMQALNYAGAQILKLTQNGALTVSSFIGNLTGNVTGNLTGTASLSTSIAAGAAGSMPYQTGAGVTAFLASSAGKILSVVGTTPTWFSALPTTVSISTVNVSPTFNGASNFLQVGADGKLPTIDGSNLTNVNSTLLAVDTVAYISSASNFLWTPWANIRQIISEGCAQGGGGAGAASGNGTVGSSTTWIAPDGSTVSAVGGSFGIAVEGAGGIGGTGGLAGFGGITGNVIWASSSVIHLAGNGGGGAGTGSGVGVSGVGGGSALAGGGGAGEAFGGSGSGSVNGAPNTGGGGSGQASAAQSGGGGGGGECFRLTINSPSASGYRLTVGSLGGAGGAGVAGNGGTGYILITGKY